MSDSVDSVDSMDSVDRADSVDSVGEQKSAIISPKFAFLKLACSSFKAYFYRHYLIVIFNIELIITCLNWLFVLYSMNSRFI